VAIALATPLVAHIVREALAEDLGSGDLTTALLFPSPVPARAEILARKAGVICGLSVAEQVFRTLDEGVRFEGMVTDGDRLGDGRTVVARLDGSANALLTGERTALNLLGHLSGVATLTRQYVDAIAGTSAVILDTRKTTPGLRLLEKEAVRCGGGTNHRLGLHDAILVKDNHLRLAGGIAAAVERLRAETTLPIEVECDTLEQVREALDTGADRILLDNMRPQLLRAAVAMTAGRAELEASGGVSLETVRAVAETGVDFISVGALTHSAPAVDVSMEVLL
jgi:nicotinate-nucleotide pyrophosphorylase (carboxylating)